MDKIDLVITSVFPTPEWIQERQYYKNKENSTDLKMPNFNGECRYRDFNTLRFWFRSIEVNCNWYNKIFLILQDERQIPSWLNTNNPKLRIVFHDEYIPGELLPTYNSNCIEMFIPLIPDLSEKYIIFNDDMFILNKVDSSFFFNNDKPVYDNPRLLPSRGFNPSSSFLKTLKNNSDFESKYKGVQWRIIDYHLVKPMLKSFCLKVLNDNYNTLYNSISVSRFRSTKNHTHWIYSDLLQLLKLVEVHPSLYKNSRCVTLMSNTDIQLAFRGDVVCFNDTNSLSSYDFDKVKNRLLSVFLKTFPSPSAFEKKDRVYILKDGSSEYLNLDSDYNNIIVDGSESFDFIKVKYFS